MDSAPGRSIDIELGGQEVISVDLVNLDPSPADVLDLLKEGNCKVWVWTKLAGEYWRRGFLDAAERIALTAVESFENNGLTASLPPIYSLLANIQMAYARKAPKLILSDAQQDILSEKSKEDHYREAAQYLNLGVRIEAEAGEGISGTLAFLTRGIQQLATRSMDDALRSFDGVLAEKPTNVVALLAKARILYTRRNFKESLRLFQDVLRYNPNCLPDPRIGIGLCLWAMDQKAKAKAAWQRSLEVNPSEWSAQLLLGLESINASKTNHITEEEKAQLFLAGTKMVERAFHANNRSASAANALCELFLRKGSHARALKLAERTIQFADTLTVLTEGYLRAGRVSHSSNRLEQGKKFYMAAIEGQPKNVIGAIGLAQMQMLTDEMPAAIHTLDTFIQQPNPQRSIEATVMLASLRAFPRPGVSSSDIAQEKARARSLFDRVAKGLEIEMGVNGSSKATQSIADDVEMHIEVARLWQGENMDRMGKAMKEALRVSQAAGETNPRLVNNIAVLHHLEGNFSDARTMYEHALTSATTLPVENAEGLSTTVLYNLARVYEDQGEESLAKDAYEKLLSRHPEYIDAKIRQAQMLTNLNRVNDAHDILKQCLSSQNSNLNLRAFYTHFLIHTGSAKIAKEFVFTTLKDFDRHDTYSLCASAWIIYQQARESRDNSQKGVEERKKNFQRAADFYEKALQLDPTCAFAAQGLAIVTAEDALGTMNGAFSRTPAPDESQRRLQNAREALDIFLKVRESINDGSVYFNIGHCYYARDEFDRAIESYETASTRFYRGQNTSVLLCLCRSWYSKAMRDQSYTAMKNSLKYAQAALHIHPNDKAILYNIAMIQQKSAELLFSVNVMKRTVKDLQRTIDSATHAQKIFASLAADRSQAVPYDRDIADNRRKYGDGLLRKAEEHLAKQRQHEDETNARLEAARRKRQEDKERQDAIERVRVEEARVEAEKLAEERRLAREQAFEWTRDVHMDSDDEPEREKKPKRTKKAKADVTSGDEGEPKKKRKGKLKKSAVEQGDEEQVMFTEEDDGEKPAKKRLAKKRVVRDDDEEDTVAHPRKKQYKSKEMLSDTDEEMS